MLKEMFVGGMHVSVQKQKKFTQNDRKKFALRLKNTKT